MDVHDYKHRGEWRKFYDGYEELVDETEHMRYNLPKEKGWGRPWQACVDDKTDITALCYTLGVLLGDGWVSIWERNRKSGGYSYEIGLRAKDRSFVKGFKEALSKLGLNPSRIYEEEKKKNWSKCFQGKGILEVVL